MKRCRILPDNNYREMYVSEAIEHIELMNQTLLQLEDSPTNRSFLDQIFRSAHTIKGMASTMEYSETSELCKNIENIFDEIRKGEKQLTHNLTSALFVCIDLLQQMISDEKLKIDLKPYLKKLESPDEDVKNVIMQEGMKKNTPSTIRVKMSDMDSIVDLVGELLTSKMQLQQTLKDKKYNDLKQVSVQIDRLVTDLQYHAMKIRLVPINQIFDRCNRTVRDTSQKLGKKVNLNMDGSGIELDRNILDSITDPLLHILRNCVDHGLESSEDRTQCGKSETGNINVIVERKGENVLITIDDDGKGIDVDKVKEKAVDSGIITLEESSSMSDEDAVQLIGAPGLSTAKKVTDISGRGVGMDVVISQIEAANGTVKITSQKNKGTQIVLSLPLSLSIIRGLLVNISGERFAIPLSNIITTVKIKNEEISILHNTEFIKHEESIIPLIRLDNFLEIKKDKENLNEDLTVIIIENNGKKYGFLVDEFERNQEIVIKKLNENESSDLFSNATILPDGKIALVIDPSAIIN
ncbi:MAG: chemotaxis protein CheA [Candidatus Nitrosopumilus sp. bin_68KS]